jgi:nucleoside-diphosphate-sugar epimerase
MVHVEDVVRAALLVADHPVAKQKTYIVTDGQPYSSRDIVNLTRRALGKRPPARQVPASVLRCAARLGDAWLRLTGRRAGFDSEALDKLLGWAWYCSARIQRELTFSPTHTLSDSLPDMLATDRPLGV